MSAAKAGALLHSSPAKIAQLPPAIHKGLVDAFSSSLHTVFLWAVPIGVVAFVVSLCLREVPLRDSSGESLAAAVAEGGGEVAAQGP